MSQEPGPWRSLLDGLHEFFYLAHCLLVAWTGVPRTHMLDYVQGGRNGFELLGHILGKALLEASAPRTDQILGRGLMYDSLARQILRKEPSAVSRSIAPWTAVLLGLFATVHI